MIPLIVFAKVPIPGFAKTRIAEVCGTETADRIYRELLAATARSVVGLCHHVAYTGAAAPGELERIFPEARSYFPQTAGTLGERMGNAFIRLFGQHAEAAIAIGCDCPSYTPELFHRAIDHLQGGAEVAIAPAPDGGYTLIGCRPQALPVFQAREWGKPGLFAETLRIVDSLGLRLELLPELPDIDTYDDYLQWHK